MLLSATLAFILGINQIHRTDADNKKSDEKHKVERDSDKLQIAGLNQTIETEIKNNETQYARHQQELHRLQDQLSDLKKDIATEELRKKMTALQGRLDKALVPTPTAVLEPSFWTIEKFVEPISETTVKLGTANFATVEFYVFNKSDVVALNGGVHLRICMACKFAKEPQEFHKIPGSPDWDRQYDFQHIYPHAGLQKLSADIIPPPGSESFQIEVMAVCDTCPPQEPRKFKVNVHR